MDESRVEEVVDKISIVYKRLIIVVISVILLILILADTLIVSQTIKARNYTETKATYVEKKQDSDSEVFDEYIYSFNDKNGNRQEINVSISKGNSPKDEIIVKYNENDPKKYYEEDALLDKKEIVWYIVKIILLGLLICLFFNKNLLRKINLSAGVRRNN